MIQSVDRALRLLAEVRDQPGLSLTALSEKLSLLPSTAARLLATLEQHGLVERQPTTKTYRLGPGALALSARVGHDLDLPRRLEPVIQRLAANAGEQTSFAVLEGRQVVHLLVVDGAAEAGEQILLRSHPSLRDPNPNATALGKVLLAFSPKDVADAVIDNLEMPPTASRTITDPAALRRHLASVRRNGYAFSIDENTDHVRGVAAPIRRGDGLLAGAIAVHGPTIRLSQPRLQALVPAVREAAAECSMMLRSVDGGPATANRPATTFVTGKER